MSSSMLSKSTDWLWLSAFASPQFGSMIFHVPIVGVLAGIYAKYHEIPLTVIAVTILFVRLFDAVSDPLIGYLSDWERAKTGDRKWLMRIGGVMVLPCAYFLLVPGPEATATYFTFWYVAFYFAHTLFAIPYIACANDYTGDSSDKTKLFALISALGQFGGAIFYVLPLLPLFSSREITPEVLRLAVIIGGITYGLAFVVMTRVSPRSDLAMSSQRMGRGSRNSAPNAFSLILSMLKNRPFRLFIAAFMLLGMGTGMWAGMFFIFVDMYLAKGDVFAGVSLIGLLVGVIAAPVWCSIALKIGKRFAWQLAMGALAATFLFTGLLSPSNSSTAALLVVNMLVVFVGTAAQIIAPAVLCDIIDYSKLSRDEDSDAAYFAVYSLMTKSQAAVGAALGMTIAGAFGFVAGSAAHTELAVFGLMVSVSWLPSILVCLALVLIAFIPLSEAKMTIVRRRLEVRQARKRTSLSDEHQSAR